MDKDELLIAIKEMSNYVDYTPDSYRPYEDHWSKNYDQVYEQWKQRKTPSPQPAQKSSPPKTKSKPKVKWSRDVGHGLVDIINDL